MTGQSLARPLALAGALALLAACGGEDREYSEETGGREETRTIRNTESIGYGGEAIADKIDATLDANEKRIQETEDAADDY